MRGESFASALCGLRAGSVDFRVIESRHRGVFVSIARSELKRWPPSHLTVDDLVQEALLMCWRAVVEYWDPERGVALDRYVKFRVSRYLRRVMLRASGWPVKGRSKPARPVRMTAEIEFAHEARNVSRDVDWVEVSDVLRVCCDELASRVLVGVVLGMDAAAIAAYLYADPFYRLRYRFDSVSNARHKVRRAIGFAARDVRLASGELGG